LAELYEDSLAVIRYHVWWPSSGDPFYQFNIQENTARNNFYGNNYAPHLFVDGTTDAGSGYSAWESIIRDRWNYDPYLEIGLFGNYESLSREVDLTVKIMAPGYVPQTWDLRLFVVLIESDVYYGGRYYDQVMRDIAPYYWGDTLTIHEGETKVRNYIFTVDNQLDDTNCDLVVFVQNADSYKAVLQATKSDLFGLGPLGVEEDLEAALPTELLLLQNYPNPFNASTRINYRLTEAAPTKLDIFNLKGELVRSLVNEVQTPGDYQLDWDGTDAEGEQVSSGLYFYRLTSGETTETQKMSLLR
jgi:hypothetical protein